MQSEQHDLIYRLSSIIHHLLPVFHMASDLLAIFSHPDDAELLCGGTIAVSVDLGHSVGLVDLTRGELGSKGTPEIRAEEAKRAAEVLGVSSRECLGLPDGRLTNNDATRRAVVEAIRRHRPRVVLTHYLVGRHPDHRAASELVRDACFLSGLKNYPADGDRFRPEKVAFVLSYREDVVKPTFIVDTTNGFERKLQAMACFDLAVGWHHQTSRRALPHRPADSSTSSEHRTPPPDRRFAAPTASRSGRQRRCG